MTNDTSRPTNTNPSDSFSSSKSEIIENESPLFFDERLFLSRKKFILDQKIVASVAQLILIETMYRLVHYGYYLVEVCTYLKCFII